MGRVWVAIDTNAPTLRLVALKTTLGGAEAGMNRDFWAALADEAAVASRIQHPNVCATYELGQEGAVHFLVMEWSDGASLRDLLSATPDRRLSPEVAAFVCASVAAGLHVAHELVDESGQPLGVVHRDVSPQNILISMRGHVRLADFGVAKSRGQLHRPTETGEVKGKLSYMAPEQVTSKVIDRRADVFALGCVLYEAVLGVRPFHGTDALATMYKILEEEVVAPRSIQPDFPEALERLLFKALAKDPNARYQTAEEFREALLDYLSITGRVFADKHVAELLRGVLGEQLSERNRSIMGLAKQLRDGETNPERLSPPAPPLQQTLTPEGGVERSVSVARKEPPPRPRNARVLTLTVVAAVVAAAVWLRSESRGSSASAVTGAPATSARALETPVARTAAESEAASTPSASGPIPALADAATAVASAASRRPSRVAGRPPATPASAASASSMLAGKPAARKPRPIDRDNPFATP